MRLLAAGVAGLVVITAIVSIAIARSQAGCGRRKAPHHSCADAKELVATSTMEIRTLQVRTAEPMRRSSPESVRFCKVGMSDEPHLKIGRTIVHDPHKFSFCIGVVAGKLGAPLYRQPSHRRA